MSPYWLAVGLAAPLLALAVASGQLRNSSLLTALAPATVCAPDPAHGASLRSPRQLFACVAEGHSRQARKDG